jgi:hypothetical protein
MQATTQSGLGSRSAAELKPAGSKLVGSKMTNAPQKSVSGYDMHDFLNRPAKRWIASSAGER